METLNRDHQPVLRAPSRRAVVGAAVWGAPAIVAVTAVPAFAVSGTIVATYNADSFRTNQAALQTSTPSGTGGIAVLNFDLVLAQVTDLTCLISSAAGVAASIRVRDTHPATTRGATTWSANNADLAPWSASPTAGTAASTITLTRAVSGGTAVLKVVLDGINGADYPLTFRFSSPGAVAASTVTVSRAPATDSFISGATTVS